MILQLFLFLLLSLLILYLARLCHLYLLHHCLPRSRAGAGHPLVHRLLKPRNPGDCPACRLSSTFSVGVGPSPPPVRPWREVKSRRGAPKRANTQGFACPNQQCPYSGITDAHIHALVGDGKHGLAERIQTFRCQACHTTFTARRHTPLYRLKTPRHGVAALARRTWATAQQSPQLLSHLEWWRAYYHFVRPHASLRVALVQPRERGGKLLAQRYRQRTPAMAAGRTNRRWTARELLCYPISLVPQFTF